jgi:serine phosphatase RsbU (regulator of sigma subunit)/FixJ family two-component response regulator/anti-sigma regulatory factor (Ser/Thr protein kinase)
MTTSRITILIVDDDPALLKALPETVELRLPEASIETCDSAATALTRILAVDYDAIVTDIKMPGMDGLALLAKARVLRPDTPTLIITGHGEHDLAIQALRAGAYDYIQKPIDRDYFIASLNRAVQVRQLRRQVAEQRSALARHAHELEDVVQARTHDLREAADRVRALTEVAAAIHGAQSVGQVLQSVVDAACRLSGAGVGMAGFFRGQADAAALTDSRMWEVAVAPPDVAEQIDVSQFSQLFTSVCVEGKSTRISDVSAHPLFREFPTSSVHMVSYLAVPVRGRSGQMLGAIILGLSEPGGMMDELQVQIEALARQAAVALENALLYERERRIAETLQRGLLPERLPQIPGVDVAARYRPGSQESVGGDWYDVFLLPTGHVGLVMGDIAGRGVWAAAVMGQLRNALRAYALEGNPPAVIGEQLNRLIYPGAMATLVYLAFDPDMWTVRYFNAGHLPPLVISLEGTVSFLEGGSPPLGAMPGLVYREETAALRPGSTIVLYTDGLAEVKGKPIDDGLARIKRAVAGTSGLDLNDLLDRVLSEVLGGNTAGDDVALLALRASALDPDRLSVRLPATPSSLLALRHTLRRWLRAARVTPDEEYEIVTACNEACANAIEHAYGLADAIFDFECLLTHDGVAVMVRDVGNWRPPRGHQGLGLELMHALMDGVEVDSGPGGTTVQMRRRLAQRDQI